MSPLAISATPTVKGLFAGGRPAAIAGLIGPVVVPAIDREVRGGSTSHVGEEAFEAGLFALAKTPPIADGDSAAAPVLIVRVVLERRYADRGSTDFAPTPGPRGGDSKGRWPANVIHDGSEEVVEAFPAAPGQQRPVTGDERVHRTVNAYGVFNGARSGADPRGDVGSAARFFYSAKADAADRLGSKHPTVKPVDLMAYLCRLVTPPGGTVLDPFAGSGTTGMACLREGFSAVLIEREAEYIADIHRRLAHVRGSDAPLFAEVAGA
jgi:hypothetical protein